jgi:hypothetical protein
METFRLKNAYTSLASEPLVELQILLVSPPLFSPLASLSSETLPQSRTLRSAMSSTPTFEGSIPFVVAGETFQTYFKVFGTSKAGPRYRLLFCMVVPDSLTTTSSPSATSPSATARSSSTTRSGVGAQARSWTSRRNSGRSTSSSTNSSTSSPTSRSKMGSTSSAIRGAVCSSLRLRFAAPRRGSSTVSSRMRSAP